MLLASCHTACSLTNYHLNCIYFRSISLDNGFFEKITSLDWKKQSTAHHSEQVIVCFKAY